MPSTLRNDTVRALILARIATAWDKAPELSLGQLIRLSLADSQYRHMHLIEDVDVVEAIERFVLIR